jgi:hypothetical protein
MSSINDVSRKLYVDVNTTIINQQLNGLLNVNKIYNVLYLTTLHVETADQDIFPPINLSARIKSTLQTYRIIFDRHLTTKNISFVFNTSGISPTPVPDDDQNRYIFSTLIKTLANNLNSYVESDQEYFLKKTKESLDSLFSSLTVGLIDYRKYFSSDISSNLISYSLVQDIASETSEQRRSFFDTDFTPDQTIALNNVNINNPIGYDQTGPQDWRGLFNNVITVLNQVIYNNLNLYFIRNQMFNSIQSIINDESISLQNKIDFSKDYIVSIKEEIVNNVKKLKILSPVTVSNDWNNRSVFYYTSLNAYSKSKINEVDVSNKIIKLSPYLGLTTQAINQTIKFATFKEGINIEKNFQNTVIQKNTPNLFSLQIIETNSTGETITKDVNFSLSNTDFNQNFITFSNATSDPLKNGWGIYLKNSKITNSVSFYRDNENSFIFSKNSTNSSGSYVYFDFYIDNNNLNSLLNLSFKYEILNNSFNQNELKVQIEYFKNYISGSNYNVSLPLKTFNNLNKTLNNQQNFTSTFNTNSYNYYRFKIYLSSETNNLFTIKFNDFYIGTSSSPSSTSISITNPNALINLIYRTSGYKNNKDLSFSSFQATNISDLNITSTTYKIKVSSEPYHVGSSKKIKFYNINSNLKWLFLSDITTTQQIYSGLNPITFVETGREKKYYDSFISLIKRVFTILNAYALSRLLVPEAFDEETSTFNIGINVTPSVKVLIQDLIDDLTIDVDFRSNFEKDPRSNFMQKNPQDNLNRKSVEWKTAGLQDAMGLKKFAKFKSDLEKIKRALKIAKSVLEAIRAFIDILSDLIEMGEDILGALLDQVIKQVEGVVDNIASTGVYWLPLIRYFATTDSWWWFKDNKRKNLAKIPGFDEINTLITTPFPNNSNISVNNSFLLELEQLFKSNDKMMQDDLSGDLSNIGLRNKNSDNWQLGVPFLPFRSTTYEEFKNVIIDAFLDEDDLPELGLRYETTKNKDDTASTDTVLEGGLFNKNRKGTDGKGLDLVIKPGAPRWTKGSQSATVIVCICLPAPEDLITGWKGFLKALLVLLKPIARVINLTYTGINNDIVLQIRYDTYIKNNEEKIRSLIAKKKEFEDEVKKIEKQITEIKNKQKEEIKKDPLALPSNIEPQITIKKNQIQDLFSKSSNIRKEIEEIAELNRFTVFGDNNPAILINDLISKIEIELSIEDALKNKNPTSREEAGNQVYDSVDPDLETDTGSILGDISKWWNDAGTVLDNGLESRANKFSGSLGNYPDFVGMTLGSIAPGLFTYIKGFLHKLRKLNRKESTFSLSEKYELMIKPITEKIKEIEEIIKIIDAIVNAIDAILGISLTYLVIKSNGGVTDIIEQLENSTGFPNETKRQIILGGVLAAGTLDPNGNEFNMQGYFDEASQEFNELAGDLFDSLKQNNEQKGISFLNKFFG